MKLNFIRHSCARPEYCKILPRLTYNAVMVELPTTGIEILKSHWDLEKKRVTSDDPHYSFKNEQLADLEMQVTGIYNEFIRKKIPFDVHQIKNTFINIDENFTVLRVFDMYIDDIRENKNLAHGTKVKYQNVRSCVSKFLIAKNWENILIERFEEPKLQSYRSYLIGVAKFQEITAHKRCQVVKQLSRWAKKRKLIFEDPLEYVRLREPRQGELIYLSQEQFEQLKNHKFKSKLRQEVADVFIVFCRTGFHYQDLKNIVIEHQKYERKGIDGNMWLHNERVKTEVIAKVPYFDEVIEILKKYNGWENLPIKTNSKMNAVLKIIADELEFPQKLAERISVKAGRKTIADYLRNEQGWGTDELKILLGINNDKYVNCYSKADERKVVNALRRSGLLKEPKHIL
jgi:integrase/recombinase XerD